MKEQAGVLWNLSTVSFGAFFGALFGGWSQMLFFLLLAAIVDYISGLMAAGVNGELKSKIGYRGIAKKAMMFFIVILTAQLDAVVREKGIDLEVLGLQASIQDATITFYLFNELLSVIENAGRIGVKMPDFITNAVEILKNRQDKKGNDKDVNN